MAEKKHPAASLLHNYRAFLLLRQVNIEDTQGNLKVGDLYPKIILFPFVNQFFHQSIRPY